MTQPPTTSNCHNAPVTIGGRGDFDDKDKIVTQYYVCSKCNKPCDLAPTTADWLDTLLNKSPTDKEVPESVWGDIHATWTGLWLDSWGEWDELPASEVFPIADFLTDERIAWLKQSILSHIQQVEVEAREKRMHDNESICGCPMCDFHTKAYGLTTPKQPKGDSDAPA